MVNPSEFCGISSVVEMKYNISKIFCWHSGDTGLLPEFGDIFGAYNFKLIIQAEVLAVQLLSSMGPSFFSLG